MASKGARKPNDPESIEDVIGRTKQAMALAQVGLKDLIESTDVTRQIAGISQIVVQGRAVTNIVAHIRTFDREGFDAWYAPREAEMRGDPLMRFFYKMRTLTLKEGAPPVYVSNSIEPITQPMTSLGSTAAMPGMVGDHTKYFKSSYFETRPPLGQPQRIYVPLPETQNTKVVLVFADPPYEHMGQMVMDITATGLCRLYVEYLGNFVRDAEAHFLSASKTSRA